MSVHEARLWAEYEALQKFRSRVVTWEPIGYSKPPDVYRVTYQLRSLVGFEGSTPIFKTGHEVEIELSPDYPRCPPVVWIISRPIVLHPNIWTQGRVCIEDRWKPVGMYLDTICELVGKMIAYQTVNIYSPANRDPRLLDWVRANQDNPRYIPTDNSQIRLPAPEDTIVWGSEVEAPPWQIIW